MQYTEILIENISKEQIEILTAILSDANFESFLEEENCLKAYIPTKQLDSVKLQEIANEYNIAFTQKAIEPQNWNALWESSFEPIVIENCVAIRAHFHNNIEHVAHNIIITPKMSFGTGHHATTQLMLQLMQNINFTNKSVLDYGCGTGVLAIYASKLGATNIVALDYDEWSTTNTHENLLLNNCTNLQVLQGELSNLPMQKFDIILANINLNVLQANMTLISKLLNPNGILLLSGILESNEASMSQCLQENGLEKAAKKSNNNWLAMQVGSNI